MDENATTARGVRGTSASASPSALGRYRLRTSFVVRRAAGGDFDGIVGGFRDALGREEGVGGVTVESDGAARRLVVGFDVGARSFSEANLRGGLAVLRSLMEATGDAGGLAGVGRLGDAGEVDCLTDAIVDDRSVWLWLSPR